MTFSADIDGLLQDMAGVGLLQAFFLIALTGAELANNDYGMAFRRPALFCLALAASFAGLGLAAPESITLLLWGAALVGLASVLRPRAEKASLPSRPSPRRPPRVSTQVSNQALGTP
jgi:hypothetical protein